MIHGRNLIVSLDGVAIAGAKSCRLSISQEFLKACSPTASRTFDKIPTTYDWGVSADCLIPASTLSVSLTDKLIAGTKCMLTFTDGSGQNRAGWVYVKNCDEAGPIGSLATFSASFESTGELYKYEMYTANDYAHGASVRISYTSGVPGVSYSFSQMLFKTKGFQIKPSANGILCIIAQTMNAYVVYQDTAANIDSYFQNQDTTSLNTKQYAAKDTQVPLTKNTTYAVAESIRTIGDTGNIYIFLYQ